MTESLPTYKCTTCSVRFDTVEIMRKHYDTEYHLNNVRLRVEGKKTLTQTEYRHSYAQGNEEDEAGAPIFSCTLCKKAFRSIQTLQSHVKSTAHLMRKEQRILSRDSEAASMLSSTSLGSAAMGLHRRHKTHHKGKTGTAHKDPATIVSVEDREEDVDEKRCFFCGFGSESMQTNLEHMQSKHEFTIPLRKRCTDVEGLLKYLSRKINGLMCLTCGAESKKHYVSLEALRDHMKACSHERIVLTTEYNEFYGNTLDDMEPVEDASTEGQLVLQGDGRPTRTIFRRDGEGLVKRHQETEKQRTDRKMITAQESEAAAVMRRERQEELRPQWTKQAKEYQRREERFYSQQLRVSLRANKLHPKGYDGEGEVN